MRKRRLQPTHTDDVATSGRELGLCYEVGGQVGQGRQDEPALPHAGMGDGEVGVVYDRALDEDDLVVPHPRMWERRFVLAPLAELAPDLVTSDQVRASGGEVVRMGRL